MMPSVLTIRRATLADAPALGANEEVEWNPEFGERIDLYFRVPSMWVHRT